MASVTGWLNFKGSNAKYFPHLMSGLGADWVTFPPEFLNLVIEHQTKSGDTLPGGWVSLA